MIDDVGDDDGDDDNDDDDDDVIYATNSANINTKNQSPTNFYSPSALCR